MFATNSNLVLRSFIMIFLNIMCVFKYSLNLTKQKQNYFLVCWYYFYYLLTYIYCVLLCRFLHIIIDNCYRFSCIYIIYRPRPPLIEQNLLLITKQHKHQICHMPHAALWAEPHFFSLLLSLSFIQELIRFLWQCLIV